MALEIPRSRLPVRPIAVPRRSVPLEQIVAVEGYNPLAAGVETAGQSIGQALLKRAELRQQGEQLARLETLAGQPPRSFAGLDPSTATTFAQMGMKANQETAEKAKILSAQLSKIRALEKQFGYSANELGDDYDAAKLKVQSDLLERRTSEGPKQDKLISSYSKQLENTGIPNAIAVGERILKYLPDRGADVPGFGPLDRLKPDLLVGDDARTLRQSVSQLFNIELKDRSGAAVTDPELERLRKEFGQGNFGTEEALRQGIQQYLQRLSEIARNVDAGFSDDVRLEYQNRGGRNIGDTFQQLLAKPSIGQLQSIQPRKPMTITPKRVGRFNIEVEQ